jgi:subtilisin-like proprotein convertase family protein
MRLTKLLAVLIVAMMGLGLRTEAALYTYTFNSGFANGGAVPDGNVNGWSDTRTISDITIPDPYITDVNVRLNISGGYNGDLYVYLTHDSGFSVLLNRVGRTSGNSFGYPDSGFNVTFSDSGDPAADVHNYRDIVNPNGGTLTGTWAPDARNVDPALVLDTSTRSAFLSTFNNLDPNGSWTLFVADLSSGEISTVGEWGLDITAVPEPTSIALGIFGVGLLAFSGARALRKKLKS